MADHILTLTAEQERVLVAEVARRNALRVIDALPPTTADAVLAETFGGWLGAIGQVLAVREDIELVTRYRAAEPAVKTQVDILLTSKDVRPLAANPTPR